MLGMQRENAMATLSNLGGERYSRFTQALHWLTALLVLIAFVYGPGGSEARVYAAEHDAARQLHETLGLAVFALTSVRLLWRIAEHRPEAPPVARWMAIAAGWVRAALWLLLFLVPLSAVAGAWLEGHPLTLLGGAQVGPWLAERHTLGQIISEGHALLGDALLWIAGLHALAALYHQFVLRDGVLASMLPRPFLPSGREHG